MRYHKYPTKFDADWLIKLQPIYMDQLPPSTKYLLIAYRFEILIGTETFDSGVKDYEEWILEAKKLGTE